MSLCRMLVYCLSITGHVPPMCFSKCSKLNPFWCLLFSFEVFLDVCLGQFLGDITRHTL